MDELNRLREVVAKNESALTRAAGELETARADLETIGHLVDRVDETGTVSAERLDKLAERLLKAEGTIELLLKGAQASGSMSSLLFREQVATLRAVAVLAERIGGKDDAFAVFIRDTVAAREEALELPAKAPFGHPRV